MEFVLRRATVPGTSSKPARDRPLAVWSTRPEPVSTQLYCHVPSGPEFLAEAAARGQESLPSPRLPRRIEPEPARSHPATLPVSCRSGRQELRPGRSQTESLRPSWLDFPLHRLRVDNCDTCPSIINAIFTANDTPGSPAPTGIVEGIQMTDTSFKSTGTIRVRFGAFQAWIVLHNGLLSRSAAMGPGRAETASIRSPGAGECPRRQPGRSRTECMHGHPPRSGRDSSRERSG